MVDIKKFDSNLLKIDKNVDIYYYGQPTIKNIGDNESTHSVSSLYLILIKKIDERNGNKYLIFASADKNKEVLTRYTELCDKTKTVIEKINEKTGKYRQIILVSTNTLDIVFGVTSMNLFYFLMVERISQRLNVIQTIICL